MFINILVIIGGGIGAFFRYLLSGRVYKVLGTDFPYGTLAVNVIGCSFEERADSQHIKVTVNANMPGASKEEKEAWLKETESRCPVTDNIKGDASITVVSE